MATLTALGFQRNGVWGEETASQKIAHESGGAKVGHGSGGIMLLRAE